MRTFLVAGFVLLLAAAPVAATVRPPRPPPVPDAVEIEASVAQMTAMAECVSLRPPAGGKDPVAAWLPGDCDCAIDRYAAEHGAEALAALADDAKPLQPHLAACRAVRTARTSATRGLAGAPGGPAYSPPIEEWPRGGRLAGYGSWLEARGIPIWLGVSGPMALAIAIGWWLAAPRRRNDLIAPPKNLRPRAAPPPPPMAADEPDA